MKVQKLKKKVNSHYSIAIIMVVVGIFVGAGSLVVYYKQVYSNRYAVFWGMVDNQLSSKGVSRLIDNKNANQTSKQKTTIDLNGEIVSDSQVELLTDPKRSAIKGLTSQQLGLPGIDYMRYRSYEMQEGETLPINFDNIKDQWSYTDFSGQPQSASNLLLAVTNSFIPVGNLNYRDRIELVKLMKAANYFNTDFDSAEKITYNGQEAFRYKIKIDYAAYSKSYNEYLRLLGLIGDNPYYDESDQQNAGNSVEFYAVVGINNRRLLLVSSEKEIKDDMPIREEYYSYNAHLNIKKPKDAITGEELQAKIQASNTSQPQNSSQSEAPSPDATQPDAANPQTDSTTPTDTNTTTDQSSAAQ